jgi:N-acetylmuramoyl-L-alanine amidase
MSKTHIIIHHSLTPDGQTVSWGAIEKYHKETQGWSDIGYHAGVELIGDSYYALIGRGVNESAAACKESHMNAVGLHVCCVGNYDLISPAPEMIAVLLKRIILPWKAQFNIPVENIMGHRDFATYKSCPGKLFDLEMIRNLVIQHT